MSTYKILVVEDDPAYLDFVALVISEAGYKVYKAHNGQEAFQIYEKRSEPIDLLFTDVVMPLMDGVTLSEKLLVITPNLKVIFTSGYSKESKFQSLQNEKINFIEKPYEPKSLLKKIENVLSAVVVVTKA